MNTRDCLVALGTIVLLGSLTACGTTSAPTDEAEGSSTAPATTEQIVLVGADDEETTLDAPAEKVVALEWAQAEILNSLGAEIVGLSDVEGYESWVGTSVPLVGDPADVGTRTEPSVESIAELEPDLIVGVPRSVPDEVRDQLEAIAPVFLIENANTADPLGTVENTVTQLAKATGLTAEGEALNAEFRDGLAERAEIVAEAGLEGIPVTITSPYDDGSTVTIRMHGPHSAPQATLTEIGLGTAWEQTGDEAYDLSNIDIEGLTALPNDTWFLYWANADSDDPVATSLTGNAVWDSLPFVEAGQVAGVADGVWLYGGPESLLVFADEVIDTINKD